MPGEDIRYPIPRGRGSLITITTDFGLRDPYLGEMKGVILSGAPEVKITDITNNLSQGDILGASLVLESIMPYYPPGTIHLAVVDPTVGSERKPVAIYTGSQIIVCPDNGLATLPVKTSGSYKAYHILNVEPPLGVVSAIFHGRDVFAPACVHLAKGGSIGDLGELLDKIVLLDIPELEISSDKITGEVIYVDNFGNLITNIKEKDISLSNRDSCLINIGDCKVRAIKRYYTEVNVNEIIALIGSSGRLEIAIRNGNASKILGISIDEIVVVHIEGI
jgi:hypothetical protein